MTPAEPVVQDQGKPASIALTRRPPTLVIGGAGFIGSYTVEALLAQGCRVRARASNCSSPRGIRSNKASRNWSRGILRRPARRLAPRAGPAQA